MIEVVVTSLEMKTRPDTAAPRAPREGVQILHAQRPTVSFYRYLYNTVGREWLWIDRRKMGDEALATLIQDAKVEIHVLYADGVPAGYVELDRRKPAEVEIAYLGLIPEFIGQGLGPYLLWWGIGRAWSSGPDRVWLHTCTLDHPKALSMYKSAGFVPFKTEIKHEPDPRALGLL